MDISPLGGAEFFVLEGDITEQQDQLTKHSWARLPINESIKIKAGNNGAKVWLKTGHLIDVENQIARVQQASVY